MYVLRNKQIELNITYILLRKTSNKAYSKIIYEQVS